MEVIEQKTHDMPARAAISRLTLIRVFEDFKAGVYYFMLFLLRELENFSFICTSCYPINRPV